MSSTPSQSACRLCDGALSAWATLRVLRKYDVSYFTCSGCGSLQTETPYWLGEAYQEKGTGADTGACQRSFDLAVLTTGLLSLMEWPSSALCLDFGAGAGLYGRMMRDRGTQAYRHAVRVQLPLHCRLARLLAARRGRPGSGASDRQRYRALFASLR